MNRENFFRKFDKTVGQFGDTKPEILLHSCCGPCSSSVLELLAKYFEVTVLWYNPNLYPEAEYEKRLATQKQLIEAIGNDGVKAKLLVEPWRSEDYFSRIKGLENEPEEGKRCLECFKIRLDETARIAAERGFEWFCTTLTVSSRKDAVAINAIGREAAAKYGVKWLPSEFRKREGNHRSIILSEKYGLYRQEYCGCVFSLANMEGNDED
ncbi:MAG: epoxyqueuosine reductase QueH [Oscillospiraceae bacterium]|nr:epoxyqueuosine reductase QueH [Oscillospiraceae bacterium]